jgi:3-dehydroquinate dehydratase-2
MKIKIINGPNLNMLGKRDKKIYGGKNYKDLCDDLMDYSKDKNFELEIYQSNHEGDIIDSIQNLDYDALIINAGAYSHYSYAIRDALEIVDVPKIELHISNIYSREDFRKKSVISEVCNSVISGFGTKGYFIAIDYLKSKLEK